MISLRLPILALACLTATSYFQEAFSMESKAKSNFEKLKDAIDKNFTDEVEALLKTIRLKDLRLDEQIALFDRALTTASIQTMGGPNEFGPLKKLIDAGIAIDYGSLGKIKNPAVLDYIISAPTSNLGSILYMLSKMSPHVLTQFVAERDKAQALATSIKEELIRLVNLPEDKITTKDLQWIEQNIGRISLPEFAYGENLLHRAFANQNWKFAELLLRSRLRLRSFANKQGDTPLELAYGLFSTSQPFLDFIEKGKREGFITEQEINEAKAKIASFHQARLASMQHSLEKEELKKEQEQAKEQEKEKKEIRKTKE